MLHLGMSADGRKEPIFEVQNAPENEPVRSLSGLSDYILEDEPHAGLGKIVIRSAFVVLFGVACVAGYHFVDNSRTDRQLATNTTKPFSEDAAPSNIRKIDLTQTGSIKKDASKLVLERPIPIDLDKTTGQKVHVVKPGDTLSAISREHKISAQEIIALNGIENPRLIKPGMKLKVSR